MNHAINYPIEIEETHERKYHHKSDKEIKLCFFYHRWITTDTITDEDGAELKHVAYIHLYGKKIECTPVGCYRVDSDLFKCEVLIKGRVNCIDVRNIEQIIEMTRHREAHPELTSSEADLKWVKENGKYFTEE